MDMAMLVLTAITVVVAAASAWWSRQSARAARDTVEPLQRLGASMERAAELEEASVREQGAVLSALAEANGAAQRDTEEQRLARDHEHLLRLIDVLWQMKDGLHRRDRHMPDLALREAHGRLGAGLAAFATSALPRTRAVAHCPVASTSDTFTVAIEDALEELTGACDEVRLRTELLRRDSGRG